MANRTYHVDTPTENFLARDYDWKMVFLQELARTQIVAKAIVAAGVSRTHVYGERQKDKTFREAWDEVRELQIETLEQIAVKRAGQSSDTLMKFLLESWRPEVYRASVTVNHTGTVDHTHQVSLLNGDQPVNFDSQARRQAARLLLTDSEIIDAESEEILESEAA